MDELNYVCKCGSSHKFLRQKGMDKIGLYCMQCESWFKWIGKKNISDYTRRGMKVYPENWMPPSAQQAEPVSQPQAQASYSGSKSRTHYVPTDELPFDLGGMEPPQEPNYKPERQSAPPQEQGYYSPFTDTVHQTAPTVTEEEEEEPCDLCITRTLAGVQNSKIKLGLMGGLATISDRSGSIVHGAFKFKYCPCCARKL